MKSCTNIMKFLAEQLIHVTAEVAVMRKITAYITFTRETLKLHVYFSHWLLAVGSVLNILLLLKLQLLY